MTREAYLDWTRTLGLIGDAPQGEFVASDLEPEAFLAALDAQGTHACLPMERALLSRLDDPTLTPRTEALVFQGGAAPDPEAAPMPRQLAGGSAIAIIDDGIGFLNARFRSDPATSRFLAVWLQAAPRRDPHDGRVRMGRVLDRAAIADLVMRTRDMSAAALYRALHQGLHDDPGLVRTILQAATHGTHVLDLAAGADPLDDGDPMRQVPLIAVQLPPGAVDDTSGTGLHVPLIQGLRWAIGEALAHGLERLVVNVSLGVLAGPKDGTSALERRMERAVRQAAAQGLSVEIVLPYGNDHEGRQVARLAPDQVGHARIALRLQPQDATPSFVEIRDLNARRGCGRDLTIGLALPDGTRIAPAVIEPGQRRDILWRGRLVARLHRPPEDARHPDPAVILALAPTLRAAPEGIAAPAGAWTLLFHDAQGQDILLQIQRDDRAAGYRLTGRQAYFDAPEAHGWNPLRRDWSGLTDDRGRGPIRHDGTNSAYATSTHPAIHSVGGAMIRPGGVPEPAPYAARGADWSGRGPSLSAEAEASANRPGIIASGTLSGSTARFSGSSAAAPLQTRALALGDRDRAETIIDVESETDRLGAFMRLSDPAMRRRQGLA